VLALCGAASAVTELLLTVAGPIPYSDASLFVEAVVVPVSEELVFRAVLVTVVIAVLATLHDTRTARLVGIGGTSVAFGLAHAANALSLDPSFVISQVCFAAVLGSACAWLMVRTQSVYPAMLLHATVNTVVVAI
jgi:membrane protease YdiL (CAAX protease family)